MEKRTFENLVRFADGKSQFDSKTTNFKHTVGLIQAVLDITIPSSSTISDLQDYAKRALEVLSSCEEEIAEVRASYQQ